MTSDPQLNPYESPQQAATPVPVSNAARLVRARLLVPALALVLMGGLQGLGLLACLAYVVADDPMLRRDSLKYAWQVFAFFAGISLVSLFVAYGGYQMLRLRSLRLCQGAAIVSCIPYLSPLFIAGIPFGLWAAIVLFMPSTAAQFDRPQSLDPEGNQR